MRQMFKPQDTSSLTPLKLAALATNIMPEKQFVGFQNISDGFNEYHSVLLSDSDNQQYILRAPGSSATQHKFTSEVNVIRDLQDKVCTPKLIDADSRVAIYETFNGLNLAPEVLNIPQLHGLAREIANIHSLDLRYVDKLGLPSFTNQQQQAILMNVLDEAALTGKIPTGILERFESFLDDAIIWGYESVVINGMLTDRDIVFDGENVVCFIRWSNVQIQDPAYDLANFIPKMSLRNRKIFIDAYNKERKRQNKHFVADDSVAKRAEFYEQFELITKLLTAKSSGDSEAVDAIEADLNALDQKIYLGEELKVAQKQAEEILAQKEAEIQKKELQDSLLTQRVQVANKTQTSSNGTDNARQVQNITASASTSAKLYESANTEVPARNDKNTLISERPSAILQSSPTLQAISKDNASEIELELKDMLDNAKTNSTDTNTNEQGKNEQAESEKI